MNIEIREIEKKDYKKAIQFAAIGMNFNIYMDSKILLKLYGLYFWYSELNEATHVFAAYEGNQLMGVLLANVYGEKKKYRSFAKTAFVAMLELFQKLLYGGGVGVYGKANQEMYDAYTKNNSPDGQIVFLAADPEAKGKGIGSLLLDELEKREKGEELYLYTDDACTYQFYEHRGFIRSGEKDIVMELREKVVPLKCMLYSKKF